MAASETEVTLTGLAAKVKQLSHEFTSFLKDSNVLAPTLAADSCASYSGLTGESFLLRQQLLDTLMDMYYLTQGPSESIFNYVHNVSIVPWKSPLSHI